MDTGIFGNDIRMVMKSVGAYLYGHQILNSGLHTNLKVDAEVLHNKLPSYAARLYRLMAEWMFEKGSQIDCVVGIETGGIFIAENVATRLQGFYRRDIPNFTVEHVGTTKRLRLSPEAKAAICGKRVFLVDDVVTSGGSILKAIRIIQDAGGTVVSLGVLCNRAREKTEFHVEYCYAVYKEDTEGELWTSEQCPLCKAA